MVLKTQILRKNEKTTCVNLVICNKGGKTPIRKVEVYGIEELKRGKTTPKTT